MTDTRVALGSDRLPWLSDEPIARPRNGGRVPWIVGGLAVLVVAAAFYWLGVQSRQLEQVPTSTSPRPAVTTRLPEAQTIPPSQQVPIGSVPEVQPTPVPELRQPAQPVVRPAPQRRVEAEEVTQTAPSDEATEAQATSSTEEAATNTTAAPAAPAPPALAPASSLRLWPSRVTAGANGRVVQIGAFGSVHQAKLGWQRMARAYPGVKRLPAVVRPARNSKGRVFYRFQIGTTSQAHSEVLCQRMEKIDFSCAVVGLPWKPKGVER
jgi:outer membrane biosynthesis protein TonB